jgi:hypothetical protein
MSNEIRIPLTSVVRDLGINGAVAFVLAFHFEGIGVQLDHDDPRARHAALLIFNGAIRISHFYPCGCERCAN